MFSSLRSRLIISYAAVIITVLLIVAVSLLIILAVSREQRFGPQLQQLATVSRATERELRRWRSGQGGLEALQETLIDVDQSLNVRLLILDGGQIRFDSRQSWSGGQVTLDSLTLDLAVGAGAGGQNVRFVRFRAPDGGGAWVAVVRQLMFRGQELLLVHAEPETTAVGAFRSTFLVPLLQGGAAAFLLAILLGFLITRSVTRPLQQMAGAAEAIAAGEYEQQLELSGPSEVRRVARSFNTMAAQVNQAQVAQRDFVANVSHDLKTPLTSIQGWSQALLDGAADSPEQQSRAAGVIFSEANRMRRMVNQLLDLARLESGSFQLNPSSLDLIPLLQQVVTTFQPQATAQQIALSFTSEAAGVTVAADVDRLTQVFANLIDNALSHTPQDGVVRVVCQLPVTSRVTVEVSDTGSGIPEADLERIFERFYQVDKSRTQAGLQRGTGLGLAIVKQLVEEHGGELAVHSRMGHGSSFAVTLPVHPGASEPPAIEVG